MKKVKVKAHKRKDGTIVEEHDREIETDDLGEKLKRKQEERKKTVMFSQFFEEE